MRPYTSDAGAVSERSQHGGIRACRKHAAPACAEGRRPLPTIPPDDAGMTGLRVVSVTAEAADVVSLRLERPDGGPLPEWAPGAHIDARWQAGLERQYSLCGDPADRARWRLAVLKEQRGRGGSAYVHERLRQGDIVRVRGPRNHFQLVDAEEYLFIAGGIGITPILPMIAEISAAGRRWRLVYGGRRRASMAFLGELGRHGGAVTIHPEDEFGLLPLDSLLADPRPGMVVYCCGPERLLAAAEERCSGWPEGAFHCERFAPKPADAGAEAQVDREIAVILTRSELELTVPPGQSILEALKEAGVGPPFSCEEGTCGTCETTILEGVADHRDSLLSEAERAAGQTMMICVSRALSDRLVLDI
jgi:ferredoxin-NADP reductase